MGHSFRKTAAAALISCGALLAIAVTAPIAGGEAHAMDEPAHSVALDNAIIAAAKRHGVPERLVRRIIMRESKYNPRAKNRAYWGLMQISYPTAKSMGFTGTPQELLNPVVNLRYAVPYLANAFIIAGKREDAAVRLYAAGYYNTARSRGLLAALRTANSSPLSGYVEEQPILAANGVSQPPQSVGIFGALFGPGSQPDPQPQPAAAASTVPPDADGKPAPAEVAVASGTFDGPKVTMVADKSGEAAPPKKWMRDGGMTLVARGEQSLDQVASRGQTAETAPRKSRRARKITAFAALDLPPTTAQAYANMPAQDPRFTAAASQAAIAQATAAEQTSPTGQSTAPPANEAAVPTQSAAVESTDEAPTAEDKPAKHRRVRQARRHKSSDKHVQEARVEKRSASPAPSSTDPAASQ